MSKKVDGLLQRPMTRKDFLKTVGIGAATVAGVTAAVKAIDWASSKDDGQPKNQAVEDDAVRRAGRNIAKENKIVRTICYFTPSPSQDTIKRLDTIAKALESKGYAIQTKRICSKYGDIRKLAGQITDPNISLNVGSISFDSAIRQLPDFYKASNVSFSVDLTDTTIERKHIDFIFRVIREKPAQTFNYSYVFNNPNSSPFFPAAQYEREGFSIGLEPTDLSANASSLDDWLLAMRACWHEIDKLFAKERDFLGIDASTAPFGAGKGSLVNFVKRLGYSFDRSTTTNLYTTITNTLKTRNPRPVGLNGLMLPCLEDFELAAEYDKGRFPMERCLFLSLNSGVGIDTYPIGIDESRQRVLEIVQATQALSNKYRKPLAVRFTSDGKSKIGERTQHQGPYLTNCTVRAL